MSDLAIVAIPSQDDYVWKISSEKVPHLTLMMLGDAENNPNLGRIEDFLDHVVNTSMRRFGLDVDRRGTLGDQDADVLFFKNPGYNVKNLETVRRYLLTNRDVFQAYNSTVQYPTWTPHLTLGYPKTPAKEIERDYPISWVSFDRIAFWIGDYEGPEFLLKDDWDDQLRMSELAHYGTKGMKWGVRNDRDAGGYRFQAAELRVDPTLHPSTKAAGKEVASLIQERYNFHVTDLKAIGPGHPEYENGTLGYVELNVNNASSKSREGKGVIYASQEDPSKALKLSEDMGWVGEDCGTTRAFLTHEAAHAIFHAPQQVKTGLLGSKVVGGDMKARDKALNAALRASERDGDSRPLTTKLSGYAEASGMREEVEAELFSQYHWNPNPPSFVKVWGETLHQELGIDGTPFRERR